MSMDVLQIFLPGLVAADAVGFIGPNSGAMEEQAEHEVLLTISLGCCTILKQLQALGLTPLLQCRENGLQ